MNNLYCLLESCGVRPAKDNWPMNEALTFQVCRWLSFASSWRDVAAKSGILKMPCSHANYLDPRDRKAFPKWWKEKGLKEYAEKIKEFSLTSHKTKGL